ncbi:MAG: hypothetical protein AAF843_00045 [Bacteroidota bacterium]
MTRKILSMLCGGLCLSLTGWAQNPEAQLDSTPLKVYGDSIKFKASITVPKHKVFKKEGTYVIMPELGEYKFEPIRISSAMFDDPAQRGIMVDIESSAPFNEDMIGNDLEIEHEYEYKNGAKNVEFKDMDDLAECCITTGTLFALNGQYELMNFSYTPAMEVPLKVAAQINFPQDVAKFSSAASSEAILEIENYLKTYPTADMTIRAFASPEGTTERNKELARKRAEEVKDWVVNQLNEKGFGRYFNASKIQLESIQEDWKGFEYLLSQSELSENKKEKLNTILYSDKNAKEKEDEIIAELGGIEKAEKYLMPLRRTTIVVADNYAYRAGYSSAQIDSIYTLFNEGSLTLSGMNEVYTQEEMLTASQRTNAAAGKLTVLNSFYETYPADVHAYSNLGALTTVNMNEFDVVGGDDALVGVGFNRDLVDIDSEFDLDKDKLKYKYKYKEEDVENRLKIKTKIKEDLNQSEILLTKAYHEDPENFVTLNNLGAHYLTIGEYEKAKEYLDKSANYQDSEGVNYNLGVYYARMGNYDQASYHFNKVQNVENIEYNRGLAKLMTGDNAGALEDLKTFSRNNAEYALGHYLTAVAAARIGNENVMIKELEHAMNRDSRLSDIAEEDLEFRNYWDDKAFKRASDDDFTESTAIETSDK